MYPYASGKLGLNKFLAKPDSPLVRGGNLIGQMHVEQKRHKQGRAELQQNIAEPCK